MAIAAMQKIQIFVHERRTADIIKKLHPLAILELLDIESAELPADATETQRLAERAEALIRFFKQLFPQKKGAIENFIAVRPLVNVREWTQESESAQERDAYLTTIESEMLEWKRLQDLESAHLQEQTRLALLRHYDAIAGAVGKFKTIEWLTGYFLKNDYLQWQKTDALASLTAAEWALDSDAQYVYAAFACFPDTENALRALLHPFRWVDVPLGAPASESFATRYIQNQDALTRINTQLDQMKSTWAEFYRTGQRRLYLLADRLTNDSAAATVASEVLKTQRVSLLEGWIEKRRWAEVETLLKPYADDVYLVAASHSEDDAPPILLKNGGLAPFEAVTFLYSPPHQKEFDPTPFLSIFFALFFGLCMSDFGYGLLLLLLSSLLLKKYRIHLTPFGIKLLTLMAYCSVPTMLVGMLTGSYFNMDLQLIPSLPIKHFILGLRLTDPLTTPLPMLIFSFVLGTIHLYTGLCVRFVIDWKQQGFKEGFLLSGLWVFFATALIGCALSAAIPIFSAGFAAFKTMCWIGAVSLVLTQGRHHKNPLMRLGSGLLSLYRLTGFVGDILSYARLFALGLVTSVLAMVINLLSSMVLGTPLIGGILFVVLLVGGHLFNFLINILGSFVHPARLQYVEYFSKFFEGGGKLFNPFAWKTKYVTLVETTP